MPGAGHVLGPGPIVAKFARSRMRTAHLISWGLIVLTITGFICTIVYLTQVEQELTDPEVAARTLLLPLIIIQSVLLMLLGTGAIASAVSYEREHGLLEYHRMTPIGPTANVLGYLFGVPCRELFLFVLTLPFVAFAVIKGNFPILTLLHFYVVFFSSVLVYSMTGMVAGMASRKPRYAIMISQGLVVLLYLVLPNLSHLGLTFFEFLTIRPTLFGMIGDQINAVSPAAGVVAAERFEAIDAYRNVPFYGVMLHPTVYSLLVQGFLIATLFTIARRKWTDPERHPFSKTQAFVVFTGVAVFLFGSLWPTIGDPVILERFADYLDFVDEHALLLLMLMFVSLGLSLIAMLLVVYAVTPTRHTIARGWRRAHRIGRSSPGFDSDAASSLPLAIAVWLVGAIGFLALMNLATRSGRFFAEAPTLLALLPPILALGGIVLFVQAVIERFSVRVAIVSLFLLWAIPFFVAVTLAAAEEAFVAAFHVALPFPPATIYLSLANLIESAAPPAETTELLPPEVSPYMTQLAWLAAGGYAALAAVMQLNLLRWKRTLRAGAFSPPPEQQAATVAA